MNPSSSTNHNAEASPGNCLVLDIGKTNVKLHLIPPGGASLMSVTRPNSVIDSEPYPHADVEGIWQWIVDQLPAFTQKHEIASISITTHGATAALIDAAVTDPQQALVMPVLDYEFTGVEVLNDQYNDLVPAFSETCSPKLPAGLNLGRQLFWQSEQYSDAFARATHILMYPQYWAWRFSGVLCSEVTSLGCHTDLWCPSKQTFSALVEGQHWQSLFPPIKSAWTPLGNVRPAIAAQTGLSADVQVFAGVHDSNASFLRYKLEKSGQPFTVISTGTWTILMSSGADIEQLDPAKDMLANVDVESKPVACARFMGGREFETICAKFSGKFGDAFSPSLLQALVDGKAMALPDFSGGSGPFGGAAGEFIHIEPDLVNQPGFGAAMASLYCAVMMDYQLDRLGASGDIFIEGAFLQNPSLCGLLAALRDHQKTFLSADSTGTVQGCASLTRWHGKSDTVALEPTPEITVNNLKAYRDAWRQAVEAR